MTIFFTILAIIVWIAFGNFAYHALVNTNIPSLTPTNKFLRGIYYCFIVGISPPFVWGIFTLLVVSNLFVDHETPEGE